MFHVLLFAGYCVLCIVVCGVLCSMYCCLLGIVFHVLLVAGYCVPCIVGCWILCSMYCLLGIVFSFFVFRAQQTIKKYPANINMLNMVLFQSYKG